MLAAWLLLAATALGAHAGPGTGRIRAGAEPRALAPAPAATTGGASLRGCIRRENVADEKTSATTTGSLYFLQMVIALFVRSSQRLGCAEIVFLRIQKTGSST